MTFEWQELRPSRSRLSNITTVSERESGTKLSRPEFEPGEAEAAHLLSSEMARAILIELSQAGFALEREILSRRARLQNQVRDTLGALKESKLVQTEYLLECKTSGTHLTRLSDRNQIEDSGVSALLCPSCGVSFSQETLSEGYSVSPLGRRMSRQSHWMTVWITELLLKLGIPEDSILIPS